MKARKLIGSKTEVRVGEVVVQVEPPEEGVVTVRTEQGEVGPLPLTCLGKTRPNNYIPLSRNNYNAPLLCQR